MPRTTNTGIWVNSHSKPRVTTAPESASASLMETVLVFGSPSSAAIGSGLLNDVSQSSQARHQDAIKLF